MEFKEELTKKTFGGLFWLTFLKLGRSILQLIVLSVLSRQLSSEAFGLMSIVMIIVSFSDIFNDLGIGPALTQKKEITQREISTSLVSSFFFGVLVFAILLSLSSFLASFFRDDRLRSLLPAVGVVLFLQSLSTTFIGLMYRNLEYKELSRIQLLSYAFGYGLISVILAYQGYGVWSLVIGVLIQNFLQVYFLFFRFRKKIFFGWDYATFKSLLKFGSGYTFGRIFSFIANQGDKIVVARFMDVAILGLYERSFQIVRYTASLIGEIIDKALFSPIARKQNDRHTIGRVFLDITYVLSIFLFPLSFFIFQNADFIVSMILGNGWSETVPIVKAMSLTLFFWVTTKLGNTIAKSVGEVVNRAFRNLVFAVMIIFGALIGANYNIVILSYIISGVLVFNYILSFIQVKKITGILYSDFLKTHLLGLICSLICFSLSAFIFYFLDGNVTFVLSVIVYFALIGITIFCFDYRGTFVKYIKFLKTRIE